MLLTDCLASRQTMFQVCWTVVHNKLIWRIKVWCVCNCLFLFPSFYLPLCISYQQNLNKFILADKTRSTRLCSSVPTLQRKATKKLQWSLKTIKENSRVNICDHLKERWPIAQNLCQLVNEDTLATSSAETTSSKN